MSERKLFKYYLDYKKPGDDSEILFSRFNRWRFDSAMYPEVFSKKGTLVGYLKFGVIAYVAFHFSKKLYVRIKESFEPPHHSEPHHDY